MKSMAQILCPFVISWVIIYLTGLQTEEGIVHVILLAVLSMHILVHKHKKVQSKVANMVKITYIVYQCICSCLRVHFFLTNVLQTLCVVC